MNSHDHTTAPALDPLARLLAQFHRNVTTEQAAANREALAAADALDPAAEAAEQRRIDAVVAELPPLPV